MNDRPATTHGGSGACHERGTLRRCAARVAEALLALAIMLVFFLGFLGIVGFSLPQGSSLRDLMLQPQLAQEPAATRLELNLAADRPRSEPFAARLTSVQRTVKNRPSGSVAWKAAESGMSLGDRHSVQTYSRSGAEIAFGDGNVVTLDENSLIVVRRMQQDQRTSRKEASMLVLDGLLRGRTSEQAETSMPLELVTPGGAALVLPPGAAGSDYGVKVNPDNSATFTLYAGTGEVRSGGHAVLLGPNQALTVVGAEPPGVPLPLPSPPELLSPGHAAALAFRSAPPRVPFRWRAQDGADAYRIEIALERSFEDPLVVQRLDAPEFVHGNLGAGRYFWRVAALAGWIEGRPTPAQELTMVLDADPPVLSVTFPDDPVQGDRLRLDGTAEPGAEVFVGGAAVRTGTGGEFSHEVPLERGVNVVVVEAVDTAGNIAHRSRLILARF
jgi:hypothetical protein